MSIPMVVFKGTGQSLHDVVSSLSRPPSCTIASTAPARVSAGKSAEYSQRSEGRPSEQKLHRVAEQLEQLRACVKGTKTPQGPRLEAQRSKPQSLVSIYNITRRRMGIHRHPLHFMTLLYAYYLIGVRRYHNNTVVVWHIQTWSMGGKWASTATPSTT